MAEVIFEYGKYTIVIQCCINDKMKDLINKFLSKINTNKTFCYLYNGKLIKNNITFKEQANSIDLDNKKMRIIVIDLEEQSVGAGLGLSSEKEKFSDYEYKIEKVIKFDKFEDLFVISTENGDKYCLKKIKLSMVYKSNEKKQDLIKEIQRLEPLNNKYIYKIINYSIKNENKKDEEIHVKFEYNKNTIKDIAEQDLLNARVLGRIIAQIIFGIKSLQYQNIYLSLNDLSIDNIFLDENYNLKFDLFSKYLNEKIYQNNSYNKNNIFTELKKLYLQNDSNEPDKLDDNLLKILNNEFKTMEELINFCNEKIFMEKFFEYNIIDDILKISEYETLYYYFTNFQKFFREFYWLRKCIKVFSFALMCENCSDYQDIYIKNKENLLFKCQECKNVKSQKISFLNYYNSKSETKPVLLSSPQIYLKFEDFFKIYGRVINDKYIITKKIIDNIYKNYREKKTDLLNRTLKKVVMNILIYFFKELKIDINLILLSSINEGKNKIIKEYFNEKETLKYKDLVKEEEEKYLILFDGISNDENRLLKSFIKNIFAPINPGLDDFRKSKEYIENIILFSSIIKKYITIKKILHPEDYIDVNESLNNIHNLICPTYDSNNRDTVLSILAKNLEKNGTKVYVSKKGNEEFKNIELASLQTLVSLGNQNKYEIHFDFGEKENKRILYDLQYKKKFLDIFKLKIAEKLKIKSENLIFTDVHHGCVGVHALIMNSSQENENNLELLINDPNLHITRINKKPIIEALEISPSILSPLGDQYGYWGKNEKRGGEDYIPPEEGWIGIGLNVLGKYDNGNNIWLDYKNQNGEFAIAYLGLNNYLKDKQDIISGLNDLSQTIYNLQNDKIYKNEEDIRNNNVITRIFNPKKCGDGICLFQNPDIAEACATIIEINKVKIKIILMCRVNPKKIRQPKNFNYCWILNPTPDEIRPYRILIKRIPTSPLIGEINRKVITSPTPIKYIVSAINSKDFSFYKGKKNYEERYYTSNRGEELSDDLFAIKLYTGHYYTYLNNYLREKSLYYFTEDEIKSWICCLQNSLKKNRNVKDNTIVYRGIPIKFNDINIGSKFYFREFVSTSINKEKAIDFAGKNGGTLLKIIIKNNGTNGKDNYCFYIRDISDIPEEDEILISSLCYYTVIDISRENNLDKITLICEGYFDFRIIEDTIYAGNYENNQKNGFGYLYWDDGSFYEGYFNNNEHEGLGKMIWKDNNEIQDKYEGFWEHTKANGFGIYYFKNGGKYIGEFKEDNRTGFGIFYYNERSIYIGNFINSLKEGFGKSFYENGDKYQGSFKSGQRDGFGIYYYKDGDKYIGEYQAGFQFGIGIIKYKNGNMYKGEFNQEKDGLGTYIYANGNKYEGEWKNNVKNGKGIFYLENGNKYEGYWKNNRKILNNYINNEEYIKKKILFVKVKRRLHI